MQPPTTAREPAPGRAATQAGCLLCFTAMVNLVAIAIEPTAWVTPVTATAVTLVLAGVAFSAPREQLSSRWMGFLAVSVLAALGAHTFVAGDRATLTGSGYVMYAVWLGLYWSPRTVALVVPAVLVVYGAALVGAGVGGADLTSSIVVVPIAGLVGVVIARNATRLRLAQTEIKAEERWRAAIMATLAHDVRSPLTSITGALELLSDDPRVPAVHAPLIEAAMRQTARIMRLATGLLEVERVDQGKLRLDTFDLHLRELLHEIVDSQPPVPITLDVDPDLLVWADRERLEQIVVNLLGNAVKHGAPPVVVSAGSGPAGWELSVRDHGTGVPDAAVPKLFERLNSTDPSAHSVGLGLWIVRLLAEAHGGTAKYEHADPGGRFVVTFPRRPGSAGVVRGDPALLTRA